MSFRHPRSEQLLYTDESLDLGPDQTAAAYNFTLSVLAMVWLGVSWVVGEDQSSSILDLLIHGTLPPGKDDLPHIYLSQFGFSVPSDLMMKGRRLSKLKYCLSRQSSS